MFTCLERTFCWDLPNRHPWYRWEEWRTGCLTYSATLQLGGAGASTVLLALVSKMAMIMMKMMMTTTTSPCSLSRRAATWNRHTHFHV